MPAHVLDTEGTRETLWSSGHTYSMVNGMTSVSLSSLAETMALLGMAQDLTKEDEM